MKLNRELRSHRKTVTNRLLWVLFYLIVIGGMAVYAYKLYNQHEKSHIPNGYIELKLDKVQYQLGESVEFTVVNHYPSPIYVLNQCPNEPLHVFEWQDEVWVQLHSKAVSSDSDCYKQPRNVAIAAEASRSYTFDDWPDLFDHPGVYRVVMAVDHSTDLPYQDFVVLKPAEVIEQTVPDNLPPPKANTDNRINVRHDDYEDEHETEDD
ncbi:hypothetical protein KC878_02575 [Candidatus Saccharibacteria bacterium]|nr:hypothetical protein [Candidatus Saccharibacteria bacterium]MCB9821660.1 hypothetical protein [Candidatus Nomurabacteria bacterium]